MRNGDVPLSTALSACLSTPNAELLVTPPDSVTTSTVHFPEVYDVCESFQVRRCFRACATAHPGCETCRVTWGRRHAGGAALTVMVPTLVVRARRCGAVGSLATLMCTAPTLTVASMAYGAPGTSTEMAPALLRAVT